MIPLRNPFYKSQNSTAKKKELINVTKPSINPFYKSQHKLDKEEQLLEEYSKQILPKPITALHQDDVLERLTNTTDKPMDYANHSVKAAINPFYKSQKKIDLEREFRQELSKLLAPKPTASLHKDDALTRLAIEEIQHGIKDVKTKPPNKFGPLPYGPMKQVPIPTKRFLRNTVSMAVNFNSRKTNKDMELSRNKLKKLNKKAKKEKEKSRKHKKEENNKTIVIDLT